MDAYTLFGVTGLCSNGMHNDSKILAWMLTENKYNFKHYIPPESNVFVLDRGFRELLTNDDWYGLCNAVYPSFINSGTIPCLDANLSRLLCTRIRWTSEKSIGHLICSWAICFNRIEASRKLYIDKVYEVLIATNNFL